MMNKEETQELLNSCKGACEWVKNHLNPHQQLIITRYSIKILSDDIGIPLEPINLVPGKYVYILDDGGRYNTYTPFYDFMKNRHPDLPPYASGTRPITGTILKLVDSHPHLSPRDKHNILVLTDNKYTYLLQDSPFFYKEVFINA